MMTTSDALQSDERVAADSDGPALAAPVGDGGGTAPAVIQTELARSTTETATLLYSGTLRILQIWDAPRSS